MEGSEKMGSTDDESTISPQSPGHPPVQNLTMEIGGKKVLAKMDYHLMPILAILYLFAFLDRGNIGNARIEGMEDDLHLVGSQYNWALTIFFFPYAALELPANPCLKNLRPSIWLPSLMVAWGIITTLMGTVENYQGLLATRAFLGVAESGLYPGIAYYITTWYPRQESHLRQAMFFSAASIASAFSGLLAFAIAKMDGVAGYSGWRWIFILEGIATVIVATVAYFFIHDSPESASFLSDSERAWVIHRLHHQFSDDGSFIPETTEFRWHYVREAWLDWKVYLGVLMCYSPGCPLYGMSFFLPTIIKSMGYTSAVAQLLTVPVYITAAVVALLAAWISDRMGQRSPLLLFHIACIACGFAICLAGSVQWVPAVDYVGVYITGIYPAIPAITTWVSSNIAGGHKRAAEIGIQIGLGNLSGVMASNFYRTKDGPHHVLGHALELGFTLMGIAAVLTMRKACRMVNQKRQKKMDELHLAFSSEELREMGDKAPTFKLML